MGCEEGQQGHEEAQGKSSRRQRKGSTELNLDGVCGQRHCLKRLEGTQWLVCVEHNT